MTATVDQRPSAEARIKAATWFADQGFGVFSVWSANADGSCRCPKGAACASAGKHPIGRQGFLEHTRDHDRIRTLLSAGSEPNYGLVCPDGVFVLDVDGDGVARLAELEARLGPLPPTLRTDTAHGQHVFLRWSVQLPRPIGQLFGYVTRWGSGAGAGYVIGPRSVHASGAVYAPAGPFTEIAELPEAWARAAVAPAPADRDAIEVSGGYALPPAGSPEARYDQVRDYVASRYMRGLAKEEIWAGVVGVLAPRFVVPLSEPELRERFERAWRGTPERLGDATADPVADAEIMAAAAVEPAEPAAATGWPEPPDDAAYHGPLGEIVRAVAPHTEADPVGVLGTLLAMVGAAMGGLRYIYQGSAQAPNLFVVLVGDSSTGRKGTAGSIAREVMNRAYPEWSQLIVAGLGSGEGLVGYLKTNEKQGEPRALVMESEFGRLLTVMGREGSTLSPMVRDAWDGVPIGRILAREQSIVHSHHVGVIAHITPVELRQKLSGTDAADGFGNRFIWLAVRRTRLVPFPVSPVEHVDPALFEAVGAAIAEAQAPGEVPWSPEARDAWEDLYLELSMHRPWGLLAAMTARTEAQIVRLALVYALLDRSPVIDVPHLRAARALWDYAVRSVAYVFGTSTGDRHADALRAQLADGPLKWEDAKRALGVRSAAELEAAVALLESLGIAERAKTRVAGSKRPATVLRLTGTTTTTTTTAPAPAQAKGV
ncbi:MAG: bifunctional DNA primase/polymerase [Chloroflexota bacterium]